MQNLSAPSTDEAAGSSRLTVLGGHLAVTLLILLGISGAILKKPKVFSELEIAGIVTLGLIYLGLSLQASLVLSRFVYSTASTEPASPPARSKVILYFTLQFVLALSIFYLARPARSMEALWLILLPPISHGVMIFSRWGVVLVTSAFTMIFAINLLRLYGWRTLTEALPSFLYAVFFTLIYTQIAVNAERVRGRVGRLALELADANRRLREYAMQVEELAITRERNRLAREIHDSVGHYLTVVNVQIAAARAVMTRDPDTGFEALHKAQSLTQEGLQEIRRSVAAFRSSPLDHLSLVECLRSLVSDSRHVNLEVELQILGTARPLDPKAELTLFRAGQEGLTNIEKHAQATHADVVLDFRNPQAVQLSVSDNGIGCADTTGGGFGLLGLQERAKLLEGNLRISPSLTGGLSLEIEVPG